MKVKVLTHVNFWELPKGPALRMKALASLFAQQKLVTPEDATKASEYFVQTDKALRSA